MRKGERAHECLWCGAGMSNAQVFLCAGCLEQMRRMLGITGDDIRRAKATGFYQPSDLQLRLDKGMSGLDQLEEKSWLSESMKRSKVNNSRV